MRYFILAFLMLLSLFANTRDVSAQETEHLYRSLSPMNKASSFFKRYDVTTDTYPKKSSYFLMKPYGYDPEKQYPLVIELHGISDRAYATEALVTSKFRKEFPVFVMVPIAPKIAFWATPKDKAYQMVRNVPYPDHMPFVIAGLNQVKKHYSIDELRIYIVGHSMGGGGVIAAMQHHSNIFAGGISSAGAWPPSDIDNISAPLFIFHGEGDRQVPVRFARKLKKAASENNYPIKVYTLKNRGHHIGSEVYSNAKVWQTLFSD